MWWKQRRKKKILKKKEFCEEEEKNKFLVKVKCLREMSQTWLVYLLEFLNLNYKKCFNSQIHIEKKWCLFLNVPWRITGILFDFTDQDWNITSRRESVY